MKENPDKFEFIILRNTGSRALQIGENQSHLLHY